MISDNSKIKFAFFGTDEFSVTVLEELAKNNLLPTLIITPPDRPVGRGLRLTPPPVKIWANEHSINIFQPDKLNEAFVSEISKNSYQIFVVASYGKIIPESILNIPENGVLNVHPSLLPKYRGASPIESQILNDEDEVGVTIMLIDKEMDHGPILDKAFYDTEHNEKKNSLLLGAELGRLGGALLSKVIPLYLEGKIQEIPQNHSEATFTKKIKKEDGLLVLSDDPYKNYLKYLAYTPWPGTFFFQKRGNTMVRVKIKNAEYKSGNFNVLRVIPEGGREMDYTDFLRAK